MGEMTLLDGAVLLATVATALFTGWAVWQRWRYTPRPLWVDPELNQVDTFTRDRKPGATASWALENRGDAAAHDVRVSIAPLQGEFVELKRAGGAVVEPGESVSAWSDIRVTGERKLDESTGLYVDDRVYSWTPLRVRLTWRQHPNLGRVKRKQWNLPAPPARAGE